MRHRLDEDQAQDLTGRIDKARQAAEDMAAQLLGVGVSIRQLGTVVGAIATVALMLALLALITSVRSL